MTDGVDLSPDVTVWLREAGLDVIQGSQTNDHRTVIWNKLGESRYFIESTADWYVVTSSDRMGAETFDFAGRSMPITEKYLYGTFGGSVRRRLYLPDIRAPFLPHELQPGYEITMRGFAGRERHALVDRNGQEVAIAGVEDLVELSHYLDVPVDVIKNSYRDPDGGPLFTPWGELRG